MIRTHIPGFPRIGNHRELKFALERHWRGETSVDELETTARELRARHWALQHDAGLDFVTVGDFAFYDQVANHIQLLGCEPARFGFSGKKSALSRYFTMARGVALEGEQDGKSGHPALEMTKWFDTNYHYLVPEFSADTAFSLNSESLFYEIREAKQLGHTVKVALIGPLTFLWLGKEKTAGFSRLSLLEKLLPVYQQILSRIQAEGVEWVQLDEPILGLDLPTEWKQAFEPTYNPLAAVGAKILLATYFSPLKDNFNLACRLPVAGLHVDAVRAPEEIPLAIDWLPTHKVLSLGLIDGRNIWRADLDQALTHLRSRLERLSSSHEIWLSTSCSLLHVPFSLATESGLDAELRSWLAFATEKLQELRALKLAAENHPDANALLAESRRAQQSRKASPRVHAAEVRHRVAHLPANVDQRHSPFPTRREARRTFRRRLSQCHAG
jgi:5-methyltetrahydropteroyltriglutamate--homocysteine methyltransferase